VGRPPYKVNCTCNKGFGGDGNASTGFCTCDQNWGGKDCAEDMPGLCGLACNQQCVDFCVSEQRTVTEFASCYTACGTKCKDDQCSEKALKGKFENATHVEFDQVSLTLALDFQWVLQNRKTFEGNFAADMAKSLDVDVKAIVIDAFRAGSTKVVFHVTKSSPKVDALYDTETAIPALKFPTLSKAAGVTLEAENVEKLPSSKTMRVSFMKSMHSDLKMFAVAGDDVPFNPVRAKLGTSAIGETIYQKFKSIEGLLVKLDEVTEGEKSMPDKDAAASYSKSIRKSLKEIGVKGEGQNLGDANAEVVTKIMKDLSVIQKKDVKDAAFMVRSSEPISVVCERINKMLPAVSQTASTEAEAKQDRNYPANDGDKYPSPMSAKLPMTQAATSN